MYVVEGTQYRCGEEKNSLFFILLLHKKQYSILYRSSQVSSYFIYEGHFLSKNRLRISSIQDVTCRTLKVRPTWPVPYNNAIMYRATVIVVYAICTMFMKRTIWTAYCQELRPDTQI